MAEACARGVLSGWVNREFREALVHQGRAVRLLEELLRDERPPLHWAIGDGAETHRVELTGSTFARDAWKVRAVLKPWAGHLGIPLSLERGAVAGELGGSSERDGVGIKVFGISLRARYKLRRAFKTLGQSPGTGERAAEVRREQRRAARLLAELVQSDLPALEWHLPDEAEGGRGLLEGTVTAGDGERAEAVVREAMDRWGRFLGSDPVEREAFGGKGITVRGERDGIDVVVAGSWSL